MPPKQVYGKRSKTPAAADFVNFFISPTKKKAPSQKRPHGKELEHHEDDAVKRLEENLGALKLQVDDEEVKEVEAVFDELSLGKAETSKAKESRLSDVRVAVAVEIPSKKSASKFSDREDAQIYDGKGQRVGRAARKALEQRDTNADIKKARSRSRKTKVDDKERSANSEADVLKVEQAANQVSGHPTGSQHLVSVETLDMHQPSTPAPSKVTKSKSKKKPQPLLTIDPGDIYAAYVSPLLELGEEKRIQSFNDWAQKLDEHVLVEKIAEASFSEVYRLTVTDEISDFANESVLKVVGLKMPPAAPLPSECVNADRPRRKGDNKAHLEAERRKRQEDDGWKSAVDDVYGEVRLLQNLNHIPGFTIFRDITILQGRPSASFARAWKEWNKARPRGKKSHYPDPSKKASYEETQLWAVIEMQDAGTDCGKIIEAGGLKTIWEVWDIFWGTCLSVAKAEETCRFEHRDMHMDNICVRSARPDADLTKPCIRNPLKRKLGFSGLETTVIDYTLSRADIISSNRPAVAAAIPSTPLNKAQRKIEVAYLGLDKDQALFEGDAEEEYQYEIYRYMWGIVHHNDPLNLDPVDQDEPEIPETPEYGPETPRRSPRKHDSSRQDFMTLGGSNSVKQRDPDPWRAFHPKTNLAWAHFILYSLLQNLIDSGTEPASLSVEEVVRDISVVGHGPRPNPNMADAEKVYKKAQKLHKILVKVASLLEPEALGKKSKLGSVRDLVLVALEVGWLTPGDVSGESQQEAWEGRG